MNFSLTDEQRQLSDTVARLLAKDYGFAQRKRELETAETELPAVWPRLVELGLPGLMLPESFGGYGGGACELHAVQCQAGRFLLVSPWLSTVLCAEAIARGGTAAQAARLLPAVMQGQSLAWAGDSAAACAGKEGSSGWTLSGTARCVLHGRTSGHYLVAARIASGATVLFVVARAAAGLGHAGYRLVDSAWAEDLTLQDTPAEPLQGVPLESHGDLLHRMQALRTVALCAEVVGGAEAALEMTVRHLRERRQFGQPLGDNQALRHRAAEMFVELEQMRSMALVAAWVADQPASETGTRRLAQARDVACRSGTWLTRQAIQLHGGMGMTDELAVGHYYRRQLVLNATHGAAMEGL